jgi:hypothetical protein
MKKLNFLLSLLVVFGMAFTFTSCEEEGDAVPPSISLTGGEGYITADATVAPGAELMFKVDVRKGDANLDMLTATSDGSPIASSPYEDIDNTADIVEITVDAPQAVGPKGYKFEVTDKDGETASVSVTVTVEEAGGAITTYTAKLMGAQNNTTYGSFLDAETGTVYMLADARTHAADVDVFYYFGSSNEAALAALDDTDANEFSMISDASWTTRNSTKFATTSIAAADFTAMENDADFVDATSSSVTNLSVGDVVAFKTVGGKMGLIHVASIDGDNKS